MSRPRRAGPAAVGRAVVVATVLAVAACSSSAPSAAGSPTTVTTTAQGPTAPATTVPPTPPTMAVPAVPSTTGSVATLPSAPVTSAPVTSAPVPATVPPATGPQAGASAPTVPRHVLPDFASATRPIEPDLAARMTGVSWHEGCPVPLVDLRLVEVSHVGFDGRHRQGRLVVHADAAAAVTEAFRRLYDARFPVEQVALVDDVGGSDDAAMAANLTTAFNCRAVTGGSGWSEHSYGRAIDLNPLQNPYVTPRGTVLPPGGRSYLDRHAPAVGLIAEGGAAVAALDAVGWQWGGRWRSIKDYQHFSASGR